MAAQCHGRTDRHANWHHGSAPWILCDWRLMLYADSCNAACCVHGLLICYTRDSNILGLCLAESSPIHRSGYLSTRTAKGVHVMHVALGVIEFAT
jgi:hypothetical protein